MENEIPKGFPKKVLFNGKIREVTMDNIPSIKHSVSKNTAVNDYLTKCIHCGKMIQTDDSTMYGDFIICPNCKKPN